MAKLGGLARILLIVVESTGFCAPELERHVMSKVSNIFDFLEAGLRAEAFRQKTIASNIANSETPGYRSLGINFKELLNDAMDDSGKADLSNVEPETYQMDATQVKSNGNDVNLEVEVGRMVKNTLRHSAYVKLLNKKYKQIDAAINVR